MDRHVGKGLAMTRVVFYHEGNEEIVVLTLSLRGGSGARDAAIHRVSGNAGGFVCSFIASQWIATGFQPRDDKGEQVIYQSVLRSFQLGFSRSINLILVDRFPALSCFSLLMAFPTTSKDSKYTSFLSPYLFENPS